MTHNADFIGLVWGVKLWGRTIIYNTDVNGTAFTPALSITTELFRAATIANGHSFAQVSIEPMNGDYLMYTDNRQVWGAWLIIAL